MIESENGPRNHYGVGLTCIEVRGFEARRSLNSRLVP